MAKNKSLQAARKAYNRSTSTKNRIDIETGKKVKEKKKQKVKSHYGQVDTKNKKIGGTDAKKAVDKNKTGSNQVKSHYGQVESKTHNTTANASKTVKNIYESNVKSAKENKKNVVSSHFGQVTQQKINKSEERGKKKFGVGTYSTANAKAAKEKHEKAQQEYEEKNKKKVQTVTDEQLKTEQTKEADRAARAARFYNQRKVLSGEMSQEEANAEVNKAKKKAKKAVKENHTLEYTTAVQDNETVQRIANATPFANAKVKDKEATDKAKRQARFYANYMVQNGAWTQDEANNYVKNAGKDIYTSQGNQILDKLGGKGTAEKTGTQTAGKLADSKFFGGMLQGSSYGDITRGVGKYNQQAAELIDTTKNSGAFNAGYMVGQGAQFMLGGTAKMTDALVRGVAKNGLTRSALNVGLRKGAADMAFEAPLNTLDALKMSTDVNGNFDKKAFIKYMALNTGLSGGMGGVIGGIGAKMTKTDVREFIALSEKEKAGIPLTPDELKTFNALGEKLNNAINGADVAKADIAENGYNVGKNNMQDAKFAKEVDDIITGKSAEDRNLVVGEPTSVLKESGVSGAELTMKPSSVRKIAYPQGYEDALKGLETRGTKGHNLGVGAVKSIREDLENPRYIFKSSTQPNSYVAIIDKVDKDGNPVMTAIHLDKQGRATVENEIASEYARPEEFIQRQIDDGNLIWERQKNEPDELQSNWLRLPERDDSSDPMISLYQDKVPVKEYEKEIDNLRGVVEKYNDTIAKGEKPDGALSAQFKDAQTRLKELGVKIKEANKTPEAQKELNITPDMNRKEIVNHIEEVYGSTDNFMKKMGEERWREKQPETAKLFYDNKYASTELKNNIIDINKAGIYTKELEQHAKKFNDLDGKIGGVQNRLNNAKKKEYPTEAEKTAHIKELEAELKDLRNKQAKAAGEIEQLGKMKGADPNKSWREELTESQSERHVNKEVGTPANLKNEDSWVKDKWNSVRRLWEDSLIDVENIAKKSGDKALREELLTAANRVRNSMHVANNWITKSRKSFDNKVGGKSLDEIFPKELIENEKKYKDFQEYLIMKHVPARHAKGTDIYPDMSPERAEKIAKGLERDYGDELKNWAKDVYDYLKDLQQYRVDSGILSKEAAEQFAKDYPFYVPTNRVNDEAISFFTGGTPNGIRTAKGGESQVLDMYSQIYTATNKTLHAAEENEMLNLYFRAKGVPKDELMQYKNDDLEHAVINATVNKKSGDSKISFFVDGKPVDVPCSHQLALGIRELDGLEFERLMKAAKVATLYGKPFKALVTDWNLVFGVRNGMRDIQQAAVNSKDSRYFGSSLGAAAHAITDSNNAYRKLYSSMGGEQAQLVSYDAVAKNLGIEKQGKVDAIHEKVQDWVDASVPIKGKERHVNPIHYIETINGGIEMMPRMSEFIGTLRKEADKVLKQQGTDLKTLRKEIIAEVKADKSIGQTLKNAEVENRLAQRVVDLVGKDAIDSAMRNANDITLNFGRSGVLGRALNMGFVPYLNPSIQGLSKLVRLFTEAGGEGGWKALASLGMKIGAFNVSLAALNEIALRNNEDYQNLNTRDKDNNFFIPYGEEGKFIKIPKPRENAVLIEPVEYGLRHFFDKTEYAYFDWDKLSMETEHLWDKIPLTDEGKQSFRTAIDNIGVINPATSNMFSPLLQTINNKTWYGGSIESAYEQSKDENGKFNVPVKDRYDTGTSAIAIALGKTKGAQALNLSPKKIDNIMDSYLGMIYDLGISQTTEEARTRGNYLIRTVASQFIKDSVFSNKLSTKAWDKTDGMTEKELQDYKGTYMYDTYKYDDAKDLITADKNMTNEEKMAAKRALQIKKNKLNREAIDGTPNTSTPLSDIAQYLGVNKTLNKFLPDNGGEDDNWQTYYKSYKSAKGFKGMTSKKKEQEAQKFLDVYNLGVKGQKMVDPAKFHDSPSWGMTGVATAQLATKGKLKKKDADTIMESCGVWESQTKTYYNYAEHGGNVKRYAVTKKNNNSAEDLANELGVSTKGGSVWTNKHDNAKGIKGGVYSMSLATGKADFKDRAYYISAPNDKNILVKMNAGRGYAEKYGHTTEQLIKLGKKADKDGNTYLSNDEIEAACKTIRKGKATSEEMACAYVLLGGNPNKNPFGAIGDFSHDGDTGIQSLDESSKKGGGGHGRRRGRRHRGGGGGGSSKGTMPSTDTGAFKASVTDPFSKSSSNIKVSRIGGSSRASSDITTSKSTLNDAYRKKAKKLREQMRKGNK